MEVELTQDQKDKILHHFRAAALMRARQWDHELAIEEILGHEVNIEMQDWASCINDTSVEPDDLTDITWEDIQSELEDAN